MWQAKGNATRLLKAGLRIQGGVSRPASTEDFTGGFVRVLIGVLVLTAVFTSPAIAGPEEDALQVVQKWAAAFNASDVDAKDVSVSSGS